MDDDFTEETDLYGEKFMHDSNAYYTSLTAANERVYELEAHMRAVRRWKISQQTGEPSGYAALSTIIEKSSVK